MIMSISIILFISTQKSVEHARASGDLLDLLPLLKDLHPRLVTHGLNLVGRLIDLLAFLLRHPLDVVHLLLGALLNE